MAKTETAVHDAENQYDLVEKYDEESYEDHLSRSSDGDVDHVSQLFEIVDFDSVKSSES